VIDRVPRPRPHVQLRPYQPRAWAC
jgi:hypothetical protein